MAGLLLHKGRILVTRSSLPAVAESPIRTTKALSPSAGKPAKSRKLKRKSVRFVGSVRQRGRKIRLTKAGVVRLRRRFRYPSAASRQSVRNGRRLQGFNDAYDQFYPIGFAEGLEEGRRRLEAQQ
ncbi:hypothetical protein [Cohnella sp. AR92]|uniref:hypothetical protein n=1 Tax=Cohnella sp. AR92 TaxID=648716 RepID=UPI000F8DAB8E|nr:hypothetical protein [Cohnella sp. AR92]RUS43102.1 hypothetical protein ELR57_25710 [Cohnella sp. AR92]